MILLEIQDTASKIIEAPGALDTIIQQTPFLAVFLGFAVWVMKLIQGINKDARVEVTAAHEEHAKDLAVLVEAAARREDRLARAFERNTSIQSRLMEKLKISDPPEPPE